MPSQTILKHGISGWPALAQPQSLIHFASSLNHLQQEMIIDYHDLVQKFRTGADSISIRLEAIGNPWSKTGLNMSQPGLRAEISVTIYRLKHRRRSFSCDSCGWYKSCKMVATCAASCDEGIPNINMLLYMEVSWGFQSHGDPKSWMVYKAKSYKHRLVGGWALPLWKMMEFVSWDDDIPN